MDSKYIIGAIITFLILGIAYGILETAVGVYTANIIIAVIIIVLYLSKKWLKENILPRLVYVWFWFRALFSKKLRRKYWYLIGMIAHLGDSFSITERGDSHITITLYKKTASFFQPRQKYMEWNIQSVVHEEDAIQYKRVCINCCYLTGDYLGAFEGYFGYNESQIAMFYETLRGLEENKAEYLKIKGEV